MGIVIVSENCDFIVVIRADDMGWNGLNSDGVGGVITTLGLILSVEMFLSSLKFLQEANIAV